MSLTWGHSAGPLPKFFKASGIWTVSCSLAMVCVFFYFSLLCVPLAEIVQVKRKKQSLMRWLVSEGRGVSKEDEPTVSKSVNAILSCLLDTLFSACGHLGLLYFLFGAVPADSLSPGLRSYCILLLTIYCVALSVNFLVIFLLLCFKWFLHFHLLSFKTELSCFEFL